ncbi:hypothetical protein [Paenibacillus lentus]|uniref:Uncharacterized protein n=1 Tax=Paenibacillus lentus TaxID=1338368 RepID=A0A3S8RPN0_9BACL|nr:hypothetical protein [Paenibacillus lentus]AZK44910.1 hypothetical protein EIM92_00795 [Paenibacillus lentus]
MTAPGTPGSSLAQASLSLFGAPGAVEVSATADGGAALLMADVGLRRVVAREVARVLGGEGAGSTRSN